MREIFICFEIICLRNISSWSISLKSFVIIKIRNYSSRSISLKKLGVKRIRNIRVIQLRNHGNKKIMVPHLCVDINLVLLLVTLLWYKPKSSPTKKIAKSTNFEKLTSFIVNREKIRNLSASIWHSIIFDPSVMFWMHFHVFSCIFMHLSLIDTFLCIIFVVKDINYPRDMVIYEIPRYFLTKIHLPLIACVLSPGLNVYM